MDDIDNKNAETKNENENKKNKEMEIVTGDGKDLEISPVYDHVKIDKPDINRNKNKKIIIPKSKK